MKAIKGNGYGMGKELYGRRKVKVSSWTVVTDGKTGLDGLWKGDGQTKKPVSEGQGSGRRSVKSWMPAPSPREVLLCRVKI